MEQRFDEPVGVMLKPGRVSVVETPQQAGRLLLSAEWIKLSGPKHIAAAKACLAFNNGKLKRAATVRRAFEAAAEEADALVPVDRFVHRRR